MKQQIEVLSRLAALRGIKVQQMLGRVQYQRNLCQRYRSNIEGLQRLSQVEAPFGNALQRDNHQRYKATLYEMLQLQRRELAVAEETLARVQRELLQAMRKEKVMTHVVEAKLEEWQQQLARQEQKIQDGMAAQTWWRNQWTAA